MQSTAHTTDIECPRALRLASSRNLCISISVVCLTIVSCYFRNFVHLNLPVLARNDQMAFVSDGFRMLSGQLIYRDFFQFVTPGTGLFYAFLFRCFGVWMWIPDLAMVLLAAATSILILMSAGVVLRGYYAVLPGLLFAGFALWGSIDATHHWYSTVLIMGAMLVLLKGSELRHIAVAGALCGLAASFTQSKGAAALAGFVVYLLCQSSPERTVRQKYWRQCLLLCAMAAIVFSAINGYFILTAGLKQWIYCMIVFPLRYYSSMASNDWRAPGLEFIYQIHGSIKWIAAPFIYLTVLLAPLIVLWKIRRRSGAVDAESRNRLQLIAITGLALFLAVASSLSLKRISIASPPALILLAWLLSEHSKAAVAAARILGVGSVAIALLLPLRAQTKHWNYVDLPAGRVAIPDPSVAEIYRWMAAHTRPGEAYFGAMSVAVPLRLFNPAPIDYLFPGEYTRPEQLVETVAAIEKFKAPLVTKEAMNIPAAYGQFRDSLQPFQDYLNRHYRLVKTFPNGDTAWERVEAEPQTIPK